MMSFKETYISKYRSDGETSATPRFPKKVKIDVCNSCNYGCVFCPTAVMGIKEGNIDDALCRRIITDSYHAGARELGISSTGEPLLNPKLEEYISLAKDLGYEYVFINTNGYLLDIARAKKLAASGVDSVKISINAGTRESYSLVHGVDAYDRVVANIKGFYEIRGNCKLYLSFVAVKQTRLEAERFKAQFSDFADDILIWNANARGGGDIDKRLLLGGDDFAFKWPCGQPFKTAVTTAEGYLLACCQDFDNMTVMADLNEVGIEEAWNSEAFVTFRKKHMQKDFYGSICKNCLFECSDEVIPTNANVGRFPKSEKKMTDVRHRVSQIIMGAAQDFSCLLCGSKAGFTFVNRVRDVDDKEVYSCDACGHVQLFPLPTREEDDAFYQSDAMYKSIFSDIAVLQNEENLMLRYRPFVKEQAEALERHLKKGLKILDIGTGYGWLVEFLRDKGHAADGVELSDEKRELCKRRSGIDLFSWNFLDDTSEISGREEYYDVICLMQLLEHISAPIEFIRRAGRLLKAGGMIYVDVPNYDDYLKTCLREYESFSYSRQHLSYFTGQMLAECMRRAGYKEISVFGHQVYSFENAVWWLKEKRPFFDYHQIETDRHLSWLNEMYKHKLESELISNCLIGIGYK
ncbi:MAG: methyltransferase domain-containing protein [Clostridiales Family XIII bacterium]|jgi:MoaA/NifB/PqqE/SkfB family radical SAM enzyme/2-polyprenyl-3-methyl-5-hydroxy-6-metoxy-1,4-benzoquinol methylase|nr:methyltransferase domain-containing protein [Clostridiales Family XIII bacterium]